MKTYDYYMQTTTSSYPIKIFYPSGDHSAVRSSVSGMYDSKWGSAPLMRHAPGYGPYSNMSNRQYFVVRYHSGPLTGEGMPLLGIPYTYIAPYYSYANYVWSVTTNRGDEVDFPITISGNMIQITFTKQGIYDVICELYYFSNGQYIGGHGFEPLAGY
jgi:hypothetical protein